MVRHIPDIAFEQHRLAQRMSRSTAADLPAANALAKHLRAMADFRITICRGAANVQKATVYMYDSSFASVAGEKSQACRCYRMPDGAAAREVVSGDLTRQVPNMWQSGWVKRVVRSTLASEAFACSEAIEHGQSVRHVLTEILTDMFSRLGTPLARVEAASTSRSLVVARHSEYLSTSIERDAGLVASGKRLKPKRTRRRSGSAPPRWSRTC